jgi:hypothetical protein
MGDEPSMSPVKTYTLIGADGKPYRSTTKGTLGGNRRDKHDMLYGKLDCSRALLALRDTSAKDRYANHRVFFADEATAIAAGYRPCANCMREAYKAWKQGKKLDSSQ